MTLSTIDMIVALFVPASIFAGGMAYLIAGLIDAIRSPRV